MRRTKSVGYVSETAMVPAVPPSSKLAIYAFGWLLSTEKKVLRMSKEAILKPMYGVIPYKKTKNRKALESGDRINDCKPEIKVSLKDLPV